ncbi:uncharacterized protein PRCAT00002520001 [Priceomyces carsonii]|uniref:uncharacterized protein n=1 Tax=Priceomyces carsonii TaxID=28549 RepID=UPI002ED77256|nr:unnamed protein product [Priceomyces carsonii]
MAPTLSSTSTETITNNVPEYKILDKSSFRKPKNVYTGPSPYAETYTEGPSYQPAKSYLKPSGILDKYEHFEVTPQIGREFPDASLKDILNDEEKLKELAIIVSRRGVVFFRNQDLTTEEQKILADKLGKLTGKPKTSGLHIHPTAPAGGFLKNDNSGETDPEVSIISSKLGKELYLKERYLSSKRGGEGWHSDITFEPVPSDYAILKIVEPTPSGGDTLWASGYALYEKLSPSFRGYLETLTGVYAQPGFKRAAEGKFEIYSDRRGAPENIGDDLTAVHPIVRTNPVTGWKSIFSIGHHFTSFEGLTPYESDIIKRHLNELLYGSNDIQVRFKWGKNDVAIWDNRSVYHTATNDYFKSDFERTGVRTVGIGERPYLDKNSKSREEDLEESGLSV